MFNDYKIRVLSIRGIFTLSLTDALSILTQDLNISEENAYNLIMGSKVNSPIYIRGWLVIPPLLFLDPEFIDTAFEVS
jgi:hypothetical protein